MDDPPSAPTLPKPRRALERRGALAGLGTAALLVLLAIVLTGAWYAPRAGRALVRSATPVASDAIVPLAGDRHRPQAAAELYRQGYAPRVAFALLPVGGPGQPDRYARQIRHTLVREGGVPSDAVSVIPDAAPNTFREARLIRAWAEASGLRSLLVVTSDWHGRRSEVLLRDAFAGSPVRVTLTTVHSGVPLERWWRDREARGIVVGEHVKLLAHTLGVR